MGNNSYTPLIRKASEALLQLEAAAKRYEQIRIQRKTVKTTKKTAKWSAQKKKQIQTF